MDLNSPARPEIYGLHCEWNLALPSDRPEGRSTIGVSCVVRVRHMMKYLPVVGTLFWVSQLRLSGEYQRRFSQGRPPRLARFIVG